MSAWPNTAVSCPTSTPQAPLRPGRLNGRLHSSEHRFEEHSSTTEQPLYRRFFRRHWRQPRHQQPAQPAHNTNLHCPVLTLRCRNHEMEGRYPRRRHFTCR